MSSQTTKANIKKMSFEEAMAELESIVTRLESGQIHLEDAIESYTYGAQLKDHCEKKLSEARLKVEKITADAAKPASPDNEES